MKEKLTRSEYIKEWVKNNPDKIKARKERFKIKNPEKASAYQIKYKYGLSPEAHQRMKDSQGNLCAICGKPPHGRSHAELDVDHDHITNKVRGLLCNNCNRGIGHLQDSIEILNNALQYLKQHKE